MRAFSKGTLLLCLMCAVPFATHCASLPPNAGALALEIQVEQLPDTGFAVANRGATSIAYQMVVRNRSTTAITLRSIEMRTVGRSPYLLRNEPATLNETIEPGKEATVTFSMWSYPREDRAGTHATVWVNGTVHFAGASGDSRQELTQSFREP